MTSRSDRCNHPEDNILRPVCLVDHQFITLDSTTREYGVVPETKDPTVITGDTEELRQKLRSERFEA